MFAFILLYETMKDEYAVAKHVNKCYFRIIVYIIYCSWPVAIEKWEKHYTLDKYITKMRKTYHKLR